MFGQFGAQIKTLDFVPPVDPVRLKVKTKTVTHLNKTRWSVQKLMNVDTKKRFHIQIFLNTV